MNPKKMFTIRVLVAVLLGLGFILVSVLLITARTGHSPDVLTAHVARQFGTTMLAAGILLTFGR